jgi:putative FmdB family regulatory protein
MPIYEYVCGKCGKKTEVIQRVNEAPLRVCPHCGGRLKKAISAPAIQFKGSGWYVTDYPRAKREERKPGGESDAASEKSEASKSEASEKKSGDAETAGKSESKSEKRHSAKTEKKKS